MMYKQLIKMFKFIWVVLIIYSNYIDKYFTYFILV